MESKIRIRMGSVEVDYEGSEEFVKKELRELLEGVLKLHAELGKAGLGDDPKPEDLKTKIAPVGQVLTTSFVAGKATARTGADLAMAAAIALQLGAGKATFSRSDILSEMRKATTYYKRTYSNNLTGTLSRLVKSGRLVEPSAETYSLSAEESTKARGRFAPRA